jgi:superfamily II DNA helicase RecQ
MRIRVMTLTVDREIGAFDDTALDAFCETHRVSDSAHYVIHADGEPKLVFVLTWREDGPSAARSPRAPRVRERSEPSTLTPEEQARYEALRQWRNQHARATGKPPYLLFTNDQAAAMARRVPTTLAALGEIEGIGASRIESWGSAVVELLAEQERGPHGTNDSAGIAPVSSRTPDAGRVTGPAGSPHG